MGMAASQARLLSLTARLHDVEFEAQSIQQAKLALADQEDAVYQTYLDALDATCITGKMMVGSEQAEVAATFKNLCGGWENTLSVGTDGLAYGLVNQSTGKLYVTQAIYDGYKSYGGTDSDAFALKMLGYSDAEIEAYTKHRDTKGTFYPLENATDENSSSIKLTQVDPTVDSYTEGTTYYTATSDGGYEECSDMSSYTQQDENGNVVFNTDALSGVSLYTQIPEDDTTTTADAVIVDVSAMDTALKDSEGQYYSRMFTMITKCGGCEVLDEECQNSSDWLTSAVENGLVGIYVLSEETNTDDGYKFEQTSTSSDGMLKDTSVSSIDSTALKKAEAEYNKELKAINRKDTQYDMSLEDLETERTSITTELESLRTVIDDNVERTFGIFS